MKLNEYRMEISLMKEQNNTEYDMYSIIAALIRKGNNIKNVLSLRDVHARRRSRKGQIF